ncbi:MAG: GFA family protein [Gammaproteobacteria bacterium]|nr:GFA family protein [Gammaproteobacteria bacterium]
MFHQLTLENIMSDKIFAAGSCRCGAVTVTVRDKPKRMVQCHCTDCQKVTGTGHAANAFFAESAVEISGETASYSVTADSGNTVTRHFCPTCGNRMFHHNTGRPGIVTLPAGCFENSDWFAPQIVVYTRNRPAWDLTTNEVPNFEEMPPPA